RSVRERSVAPQGCSFSVIWNAIYLLQKLGNKGLLGYVWSGSGDTTPNSWRGVVAGFPTIARLARVIAPGMPHHVTLRGNPRQKTFFGEENYQHYLELIAQFCRAEQVAIWAYCLTPTADPTACARK